MVSSIEFQMIIVCTFLISMVVLCICCVCIFPPHPLDDEREIRILEQQRNKTRPPTPSCPI